MLADMSRIGLAALPLPTAILLALRAKRLPRWLRVAVVALPATAFLLCAVICVKLSRG